VVPERAGRARRLLHLRKGRHHEPVVHDHGRQPEQSARLRGRDRHVRPNGIFQLKPHAWKRSTSFKDALTAGDLLMPQSILLFLKSNDGAYEANVPYGRLSYGF
jgi:hypothetical protein